MNAPTPVVKKVKVDFCTVDLKDVARNTHDGCQTAIKRLLEQLHPDRTFFYYYLDASRVEIMELVDSDKVR
jgi:hypothetical protein